ncbi:DUF4184 family protein [Streptomyces sp. CA-111067]|uniref:DUF4184 family protein n=1 Tax=Streptomyces sp. CA-111067 TaxID=3240046 RepID=UPI003D95F1FA
MGAGGENRGVPFTLSHPAVVLPLLRDGRGRGRLVGGALVAGSMAPDVPFFTDSIVRGTYQYGTFTHSLWGVATADVGIAAVLVGGWHWLLREPLVALLPGRWADAADALTAPSGRRRDAGAVGWFVLSAVIGAATHVAWDAFTHGGRVGVRLLPVLDRTVNGHPLFYLLQAGCSVAGLGVLAWYVPRALRQAADKADEEGAGERVPRLSGRVKSAVGVLVGAAAVAGVVQRLSRWDAGSLRNAAVTDLIPPVAFGAGMGAAAGLACYAALTRVPAARRLARRLG